jgi:hypothetical protein
MLPVLYPQTSPMAQPILGLRILVPISLRLQLVTTGLNWLSPTLLPGLHATPFPSSDPFGPPCASKGLFRLPPRSIPIPSVPRPNSARSILSPALLLSTVCVLYPVFGICSSACSFVPAPASSVLDLSPRLNPLFLSRNRLLRGRNRLLPRRPRSQDLLGEGCTLSR